MPNDMMMPFKNLVLLVLMFITAVLGANLRPTISLADERPPIDLKAMVPSSFGDWHEELNTVSQVIDPQLKSKLDKLYSQTLSRTYINSQGYRIMLSIAYGKNQSDALQLHKPEICYPAQGFVLLDKQIGTLALQGQHVTAVRLKTKLGQRIEPITYWTVVGDHVTKSGIDKKLTEMRFALSGKIPDGMLVRVSSIDPATPNAVALQNQFAGAMIGAIAPEHRMSFAGNSQLN